MRLRERLVVAGVLAALAAGAQEQSGERTREANRARAEAIYRENLAAYEGDADRLVLPGLLADRQARTVRIQAEATGIGAGEPVEFFLIAEDSGHAYEALAVSFATPGAVRRALVFIGLEPGRPVSRRELRFWPKGERVILRLGTDDDGPPLGPVRAEEMIADRTTGGTLPASGLVFAGSYEMQAGEGDTGPRCAADMLAPRCIASNYNEPTTVLDVPRRAPQGTYYQDLTAHPDLLLEPGRFLAVTLEPEYPRGRRRVAEPALTAAATEPPAAGLDGVRLELAADDVQERAAGGAGLNRVLERFRALVEQGRDPFVTVRFGEGLALAQIRELCAVLASVEGETGIRVEPPPDGQLYYKAFLPDEQFRNREKRISQPWELHLTEAAAGPAAVLVQIEQIWHEKEIWPELKITEHRLNGPADLRGTLERLGPGLPVILVFAPGSLAYGRLMDFLAPVLSTHGTIHVFPDQAN